MTHGDPIRVAPVENSSSGGEADAGRMLQMLWRGKWILLTFPLLMIGAAKLWLDAQTELFVATARVQVDARQVNPLKTGGGEATNKPRTVLKQQQSLVESVPILKKISESPLLVGMKTFAPDRLGDQTLIGALNEGLATSIDVESDGFSISFTSPFREEAVVIVDEALRVYIEYHKERKHEEAEEVAEIVRREWESTKRELDDTDAEMSRLQADNTLLAGTDRTPLQTKLDNSSQAWNTAHLETQRALAAFQELQALTAEPTRFHERGLFLRAKSPVGSLEEKYKTAESERKAKLDQLERLDLGGIGVDNERRAQLRREADAFLISDDKIGQEYADHYLASAELDFRKAQSYEASLAADHEALLAQVAALNSVLEKLKSLAVERDHLRGRVAGFDDRITQLELENQTGALNLNVIEYARAGIRPAYPETDKTYIYAVGLGGMLAFGLVLLLGLSDRRVREVEDVPKLLGTSVLGVLPAMPRGADRVKIAHLVEEDPHSLAAEAFRSVRTATIFALPAGSGVVLVTSANSGEGKSVCASNLAFALAKAGKKTLLIDADLRKPAQHEIYAVANGTGLAGLLGSSSPLKGALVPRVAHGLDLLPAGDAHGKSAELCEGPVLGELLNTLRESYECIVIDAPPVLETSEARILATLADVVVFVLRLEVSKSPNLKRAAGILQGVGARILGCLPNGASSGRGARAFTGGISYGHGPSTAPGPRPARAADDEGEAETARARGTDFLGLEDEEESA
jgi:capsular exopolysaccharide synthesis family protein